MSFHISKQCASALHHLHNTSRIRRFLSADTSKSLVHAFVTSRVDYCNSLLYGLPVSHLNKVQRVLNATARLVCRAPRYTVAEVRCCTSCTGYRLGNALVLRFYYLFLRPSMESRQRI